MYIVRLDDHPGFFGPFASRDEGETYLKICGSEGRIIALIKPYALERDIVL
jgi:hypothetical protein